ncbi:ABC-type transport system ATP-binding protein [Natrialba magadii ATCC 43099]|uniref:ABC transporter n=1 Tax=Natrialba magadii (strain ATCC 43099 / DSM 3394 / CCM 3739 / CIP 104546 / IAM 13178 / JCM 8861 / NBRC 102185 / NCIMB 2190 / MS3) TaxID=547559 RepID=D3SSG3_NATMM|nr:ABC transporter ATP-binding protein [Natrialba magadii]ADD06808.1 ABC-type transport system ATP-binding protein [Natrialba magadii ATCC 43099]ELY27756.1 ABC transporter [Natrialba magadii ATCC 43099]
MVAEEYPPGSQSDETTSARREATQPILVVDDLTKTYDIDEETTTAVDGVSFTVDEGTVVGLLGPNGAGKTTTIKLLLGLVRPSSGTARIGGVDVTESPPAVSQTVAAMLEGARNVYWRLTVRENIRFFARLGGQQADADEIDRLIAQVGLQGRADEPVNELSRGMKQKASLACTLVRETPIVVLDEPTLGLDVESSFELRQELRRLATQEERTVLVSSHDMQVIEALCDRVIILNEGDILADETVENLLSLFQTRSVRVTVEGQLSSAIQTELTERFGATAWTPAATETLPPTSSTPLESRETSSTN